MKTSCHLYSPKDRTFIVVMNGHIEKTTDVNLAYQGDLTSACALLFELQASGESYDDYTVYERTQVIHLTKPDFDNGSAEDMVRAQVMARISRSGHYLTGYNFEWISNAHISTQYGFLIFLYKRHREIAEESLRGGGLHPFRHSSQVLSIPSIDDLAFLRLSVDFSFEVITVAEIKEYHTNTSSILKKLSAKYLPGEEHRV